MKIILAIKTGLSRSLKAWKVIVIFWFISLVMVSFLIIPLKASLKAAFGSSMITEKMMNGINVDVIGDLGTNLRLVVSSVFSGVVWLSLLYILLSIFIAGGLFDSVKKGSSRVTADNFFRASAKRFWSFLTISLIIYLIVFVLIVLIIAVPVSIAGNLESASEGIVFRTLLVSLSVFIVAMSVVFLVADYARSWQASNEENDGLRAIGFGFSQTFRTFFLSFPLMIIMLIFQTFLGWGVIKVIAGYTPVTRGGLFLLYIVSQVLFFLKIFLKTMRYASITSMMEQIPKNVPPEAYYLTVAGHEMEDPPK